MKNGAWNRLPLGGVMQIRRLSIARLLAVSALGVLPYFAVNVGLILFHKGSIIHMSKPEWAIFTALITPVMWLVFAVVLGLSAVLARAKWLLFAVLCAGMFSALATLIEPGFWKMLFLLAPTEQGVAYWVLVGGILSTLIALGFASRGLPLSKIEA